MKRILLITLALIFSLTVFSQAEKFGVNYGVNVGQFYTGSGHGSGFIMNTNIQKGRKSLEFGMIYEENENRLSGGNAKYKVFLGKNAFSNQSSSAGGIKLKPYVHYDCIYQSSKVNTPDYIPGISDKKSSLPELPSTEGTVASMEHYTGLGIQVFIAKNICIDGSMGIGAYIGAIDHYNDPTTIGIHNENSGFVLAFDFSLGYKFGI